MKGTVMQSLFLLFALFAGMFQPAVKPMSQDTLKSYLEKKQAPFDFLLIDVRGVDEITSAIGNDACKPYNIVWQDQLKDISEKVPKDVAIVVYCRSGGRSARAAAYLAAAGYTNVYDAGGFMKWNGPTIPPSEIKKASLLPEPSMRAGQ
jgi:rhodanese-related sulfurtransferase